MSVCLSVCLFVSNKRQNGWTDRAQIFCGTSRDSRKGLWIIKISNICLHQNSIVIKFFKILKIREIFCEDPRIIFVLFYDVHENMFTTNLEDGREAPSKARKKGAKRLEFLVLYINLQGFLFYKHLLNIRQNLKENNFIIDNSQCFTWRPSFPDIPIPTSAFCIIATSLAPSPIASDIAFVCSRT